MALLQGAPEESGEGWKGKIDALSKGKMRGTMDLYFYSSGTSDGRLCITTYTISVILIVTVNATCACQVY